LPRCLIPGYRAPSRRTTLAAATVASPGVRSRTLAHQIDCSVRPRQRPGVPGVAYIGGSRVGPQHRLTTLRKLALSKGLTRGEVAPGRRHPRRNQGDQPGAPRTVTEKAGRALRDEPGGSARSGPR
jgi:hypothetical protein